MLADNAVYLVGGGGVAGLSLIRGRTRCNGVTEGDVTFPANPLPSSCNGKMVSLYIEEIIKTPRVTQNFVGRNGKPIINN